MEDVDAPRTQRGAADAILKTLEQHGLVWDAPVLFQSARVEAYREVLKTLDDRGLLYRCSCSRRQIEHTGGGVYPGTCRDRFADPAGQHAVRLRVADEYIEFSDQIRGKVGQNLQAEVGDFVLLRADGIFAYQLAVVADDAFEGITEVVRGGDLLDSTPRQIYLQRLLGYPTPVYAHLPLALGADGQKLSKQNLAKPVEGNNPEQTLWDALSFLGQNPPVTLRGEAVPALLSWALQNWRPDAVSATDRVFNP